MTPRAPKLPVSFLERSEVTRPNAGIANGPVSLIGRPPPPTYKHTYHYTHTSVPAVTVADTCPVPPLSCVILIPCPTEYPFTLTKS